MEGRHTHGGHGLLVDEGRGEAAWDWQGLCRGQGQALPEWPLGDGAAHFAVEHQVYRGHPFRSPGLAPSHPH